MKHELRTTLRVTDGGRVVIPAPIRHRLGLDIGSEVILAVEDDHATLMNAQAARRRARARVRKYVSGRGSLSRQLLAERKKEAARE